MQRDSVGLTSTSRLDAFSDGVFAIAITLLVLELDVPTGSDDLLAELGKEWPSYLGYLVSFAFIGSVWVAHSTLSKFLRAADQVLVGLNLVLLLLVSLLPFTTSLMANHLNDDGEHLAVVVFGFNLLLASLMVNVVFQYAARSGDLIDASAGKELEAYARKRRIALVVQAGATLMGFMLPAVAVVIYLVISLAVLVEPIVRAARSRHRRVSGASTTSE